MMARCERKVGQAMGSASVVFHKARKLGWKNRMKAARMIGAWFSDWRMFSVIDMLLPLLLLLVAAAG